MAPTLVKISEDEWSSLRKLREAREYFEANLDDLRAHNKRYIVLHGTEIVASADDPDDAWADALTQKRPLFECLLVHLPREGESYFY